MIPLEEFTDEDDDEDEDESYLVKKVSSDESYDS